jgi:hypothetical protein
MVDRKGTVFIAPAARFLPDGRMVDPSASIFYVSWQDYDEERMQGELLEDGGEIVGAEAAIAWGRARSDRVLIRLGHVDQTHFTAGRIPIADRSGPGGRSFPSWPPADPPTEGWWIPTDDAVAEKALMNAPVPSEQGRVRVQPGERSHSHGPWAKLSKPTRDADA